jgi:hypothetical protein
MGINGVGVSERPLLLGKIFEIDHENPQHRKKYFKVTVKIRD